MSNPKPKLYYGMSSSSGAEVQSGISSATATATAAAAPQPSAPPAAVVNSGAFLYPEDIKEGDERYRSHAHVYQQRDMTAISLLPPPYTPNITVAPASSQPMSVPIEDVLLAEREQFSLIIGQLTARIESLEKEMLALRTANNPARAEHQGEGTSSSPTAMKPEANKPSRIYNIFSTASGVMKNSYNYLSPRVSHAWSSSRAYLSSHVFNVQNGGEVRQDDNSAERKTRLEENTTLGKSHSGPGLELNRLHQAIADLENRLDEQNVTMSGLYTASRTAIINVYNNIAGALTATHGLQPNPSWLAGVLPPPPSPAPKSKQA